MFIQNYYCYKSEKKLYDLNYLVMIINATIIGYRAFTWMTMVTMIEYKSWLNFATWSLA